MSYDTWAASRALQLSGVALSSVSLDGHCEHADDILFEAQATRLRRRAHFVRERRRDGDGERIGGLV